MKFKDAYNEYALYLKKRYKKQTFDTWQYNFCCNILSFFENYSIENITIKDIINWQDFILDKNFCNNHNKNLFGMLKKFFHYCYIYYGFDETIFLRVEPFPHKVEIKKHNTYTLKEFNQFISCVDELIYKHFFSLMFFCGTRPGEAMALTFNDIKGNYISINKTIDEHGNRSIGLPKTDSSIRIIEVDDTLKNDLLELKKYYKNTYSSFNDNFFIFGGIKPLSSTTINRRKKKACERANLHSIKLHEFRHSHATLLKDEGIDTHIVSKRLGHSKTSTTIDIYQHCNKEQEKRVLNTLNSLRTLI